MFTTAGISQVIGILVKCSSTWGQEIVVVSTLSALEGERRLVCGLLQRSAPRVQDLNLKLLDVERSHLCMQLFVSCSTATHFSWLWIMTLRDEELALSHGQRGNERHCRPAASAKPTCWIEDIKAELSRPQGSRLYHNCPDITYFTTWGARCLRKQYSMSRHFGIGQAAFQDQMLETCWTWQEPVARCCWRGMNEFLMAFLVKGMVVNYSMETISTRKYRLLLNQILDHYCFSNQTGRRLLATSRVVPLGLWPLAMERARKKGSFSSSTETIYW